MKDQRLEQRHYEPLTKEMFEKFCKELEEEQKNKLINREFTLIMFATKECMEQLNDEEFLATCHTCTIQCGQEAANYIHERYNKLTN